MKLSKKDEKRIMDVLMDKIKKASLTELDDALDYIENLTKHDSSSKKDCLSCIGCQLFKLKGKDESKDCRHYIKRSPS